MCKSDGRGGQVVGDRMVRTDVSRKQGDLTGAERDSGQESEPS